MIFNDFYSNCRVRGYTAPVGTVLRFKNVNRTRKIEHFPISFFCVVDWEQVWCVPGNGKCNFPKISKKVGDFQNFFEKLIKSLRGFGILRIFRKFRKSPNIFKDFKAFCSRRTCRPKSFICFYLFILFIFIYSASFLLIFIDLLVSQ